MLSFVESCRTKKKIVKKKTHKEPYEIVIFAVIPASVILDCINVLPASSFADD